MSCPQSKPRRARAGVTLLQVLTCLLAVAGGVYVGAEYTGVTLNDVAYTVLDETRLLEQVPEEWRPELSECPIGECPERVAPNEDAAELRAEFETLRLDAAKLRRAAKSGEMPDLSTYSEGELALMRDKTVAYWGRLCEIANQVAELDLGVEPAMGSGATGHAFDIRRRAFDFGRRSIEKIDFENVDPQAVEGGNRLIEWYREGAEFYDSATEVWDGMAGGDGSKAAEEALNKARIQHAKQTDLLQAKLAELSSLLTRRYAVVFPAIGL